MHNWRTRFHTGFLFLIRLALVVALVRSAGLTLAQTNNGDLVINFVTGQSVARQFAYDVQAYVSVVDSAGNPIPGLTIQDFKVTEDTQPVEIAQVTAVTSPISLILAIDVSESMVGGGKLAAVMAAATAFVESLSDNDQVALITFSGQVTRVADLTSDHALVSERIRLLQPESGGTCLYDAARESVELTAAVQGRRAVILLTDGRDEVLTGTGTQACSTAIFDDVVDLAANTIHSPVYTVTVGADADTQSMARLAQATGGLSAQLSTAIQISDYFSLLNRQLGAQYEIAYRSVAAPGPHTLYIEAVVNNEKLNNTRSFVLPEPAAFPIIVAPAEGTVLTGPLKVQAEVKGSGDISRLALLVNGQEVASDSTVPFEFSWDTSEAVGKTVDLEVVIYDQANTEIARSEISTIAIETLQPTATSSPPTQAATAPPQVLPPPPRFPLIEVIAAIALTLALAIGSFWIWQRRRQANYVVWSGATGEPFASLVLEASDSLEVGRRFDLRKPVTSLGRSATNDIVLPDKPVSRSHAELREQNGRLTLVEIKSEQDGKVQPPRYGTFVNEAAVPVAGRLLKHGDRIRLGSRTTLRLERPESKQNDFTLDSLAVDDRTFDQLTPPKGQDPDATREMAEEAEAPTDNTRELSETAAPIDDKTHLRDDADSDGTREFRDLSDESDHTREFRDADDEQPDSTRELK